MKRANKSLYLLTSVALGSLAWYDITSLGMFVMFVPMLMLQERMQGRHFPRYAALFISLWILATTWWVGNAAFVGVVAAVGFTTALFGSVLWIYNHVWRRAPRSVSYTVLVTGWIAAEYLYLNGEVSLPWLVLGNGFAVDNSLVQWYEWTGALGGSLWVLVGNLLIFNLIKLYRSRESIRSTMVGVAIFVFLPMVISLVRYFSYSSESSRQVEVAILQPNIDPYTEKFGGMSRDQQLGVLLDLASSAPKSTSLFIAPETALDGGSYWVDQLGSSRDFVRVRDFLRESYPSSEFVVGATLLERYDTKQKPTSSARKASDFFYDIYNSSVLIDSKGVEEYYHKSKLMLGVETLPYHEYLGFLESFALDLGGTIGVLGTQEERTVFDTPSVKISTAICYESIYGEHFAGFVAGGAELMAVITNDGWWGDTAGYRQHLSYSRLRAIEGRRDIVRSANTGISAIIDQRGDLVDSLGWDRRGVITGSVSLNSELTLYVKLGDYIGRLASYIFILTLLYYVAYRRKTKDHLYQK